ncbi:MAG: TM0106 family RecB-like putative nuclease [Planctomycetota bacterium]
MTKGPKAKDTKSVRTTGSDLYSLVSCERKVALRWFGDKDWQREVWPHEEFLLKRGRDFEDEWTAQLDWPEPEGDSRDYEALAQSTKSLLGDGVAGIQQAVLLGADVEDDSTYLGIPDLLRRVEGESALGDWHYEVVDIKSSRRERSDQILQVMFYSQLLTELQERRPTEGGIILRDGREERFRLADFEPAIDEALARLRAIRAEASTGRPFWVPACDSCRWQPHCRGEIDAARDLSLVPGMTPKLRSVCEAQGCAKVEDLAGDWIDGAGKQSGIARNVLLRLRRAARAVVEATPQPESRNASQRERFVHAAVLLDDFDDRLLWFGVLEHTEGGPVIHDCVPQDREAEWPAVTELVRGLSPARRALPQLWHYGKALPRWIERRGIGRGDAVVLESRCVDQSPRMRGAAVWHEPVFSFDDQVRVALGAEAVDPEELGPEQDAARRVHEESDSAQWLRAKGAKMLRQLASLDQAFLG